MKFHSAFKALASLALYTTLSGSVGAQVTIFEDAFEGPFPGPVTSIPINGGFAFFGGSEFDSNPGVNAGDFISHEVTASGGVGGTQSYQITFDGSPNDGGFTYGGIGANLAFHGEDFGAANGAPGEDDPRNYVLSYDIEVVGNDGPDALSPINVKIQLDKTDYEDVFGDLNNDGDTDDGYLIWENLLEPTVPQVNPVGFTSVSTRLSEYTRPPVADPLVVPPFFDDEAFFIIRFEYNNGGFGNDAGNVINIDNLKLEFDPIDPGAGDFDADTDIDGSDFLEWQRSDGTPDGLAAWQLNYGTTGGGTISGLSVVPEPSAMVLALVSGLALTASTRRIL